MRTLTACPEPEPWPIGPGLSAGISVTTGTTGAATTIHLVTTSTSTPPPPPTGPLRVPSTRADQPLAIAPPPEET